MTIDNIIAEAVAEFPATFKRRHYSEVRFKIYARASKVDATTGGPVLCVMAQRRVSQCIRYWEFSDYMTLDQLRREVIL